MFSAETGQLDNTLIVFLSDNGMPFPNAKTNLYDAGMRLPLIVRSPAQSKRGLVNNAMVSWTDLTADHHRLGWSEAAGVSVSWAQLPADPRTGESARVGSRLRLAHVSRDHDVLSDSWSSDAAIQVSEQPVSGTRVSARIGLVRIAHLAVSSTKRVSGNARPP